MSPKKKRSTRTKIAKFSVGPVGGTMTEFRVKHASQCTACDFLSSNSDERRCQGVHNHPGDHWFFEPNGSIVRWKRKKDIKSRFDGCHSTCPPGHKDYDAASRYLLFYRLFDKLTEVRKFQDEEPMPKDALKVLRHLSKKQKDTKKNGRRRISKGR